MDLTKDLERLFSDVEPKEEPENKLSDPQVPERGRQKINRTLSGMSEENAHLIKRAKEITRQNAESRNKAKGLRVELSKGIKRMENPYKTLETALELIELLLNEPVYLNPYRKQVKEIRAKALNDPLAGLYAAENVEGLIKRLEAAYSKEPDNKELRHTIAKLKQEKLELGQ